MTLFQNVFFPDDDGEANKKMVPGTTTVTELCCFLGICFLLFFF